MQRRLLGKTGILVSALGFGAGNIGTPEMREDHAGTLYCPGVSSAIVGTANIANLERNVVLAEQGPLSDEMVTRIRETFERHDRQWLGQI